MARGVIKKAAIEMVKDLLKEEFARIHQRIDRTDAKIDHLYQLLTQIQQSQIQLQQSVNARMDKTDARIDQLYQILTQIQQLLTQILQVLVQQQIKKATG